MVQLALFSIYQRVWKEADTTELQTVCEWWDGQIEILKSVLL